MDKTTILKRLTEILKDVAGVRGRVNPAAKLKFYLPALYAFAFALEVNKEYPKTDLTELANSIYDPIVTLNDLTNYIYEIYNSTP